VTAFDAAIGFDAAIPFDGATVVTGTSDAGEGWPLRPAGRVTPAWTEWTPEYVPNRGESGGVRRWKEPGRIGAPPARVHGKSTFRVVPLRPDPPAPRPIPAKTKPRPAPKPAARIAPPPPRRFQATGAIGCPRISAIMPSRWTGVTQHVESRADFCAGGGDVLMESWWYSPEIMHEDDALMISALMSAVSSVMNELDL